MKKLIIITTILYGLNTNFSYSQLTHTNTYGVHNVGSTTTGVFDFTTNANKFRFNI